MGSGLPNDAAGSQKVLSLFTVQSFDSLEWRPTVLKGLVMNKVPLLLSLLFSMACLSIPLAEAEAQEQSTLVISDIDDTIKASHVLAGLTTLSLNAFNTKNNFYGMSALFNLLSADPKIEFYYVSGSPVFVSETYEDFLKYNRFPKGPIMQRINLFEETKNFKIRKIKSIIKARKPTALILIGDNGESDTDVYNEIVKSYPQLKIQTFIRYIYANNKSYSQQIEFISSFDIVWELQKSGLIKSSDVQPHYKMLLDKMQSEEPQGEVQEPVVFPEWQQCTYFTSHWLNDISANPFLLDMAEFIKKRCPVGEFQ